MLSGGLNMQTSTVSESIPITSDPTGIASWTKAITDEYPNFNIVGEIWMQSQAQMAYWQKTVKLVL
jgi:hypothetical protein